MIKFHERFTFDKRMSRMNIISYFQKETCIHSYNNSMYDTKQFHYACTRDEIRMVN